MSRNTAHLKKQLKNAQAALRRLRTQVAPQDSRDQVSHSKTIEEHEEFKKAGPKKVITTVIWWFLGVGVGLLSNIVSSDPEMLYVAVFAIAPWPSWVVHWRWRSWWITCIAFVLILSSSLFVAHRFVVVREFNALGPFVVSLDFGPVFERARPFGTALVLENQSAHSVSNVSYMVFWRDPNGPGWRLVSGVVTGEVFRELKPHEKQTIHIVPLQGQDDFANFGAVTFVEFEVAYRPQSGQRDQVDRFQFQVRKDQDGTYQWCHAGTGKTLSEINAEIQQRPVRWMDTVPLLVVNVERIDDISLTNQSHPLQITYSWANVGGMPAVGVRVDWALAGALEGGQSFLALYTNQWPLEVSARVLFPGMSNTASTMYRGELASQAVRSLIDGRWALLGSVRFWDMATNDYEIAIRAVRTNGTWEVRYLDLLRHYREVIRDLHIE